MWEGAWERLGGEKRRMAYARRGREGRAAREELQTMEGWQVRLRVEAPVIYSMDESLTAQPTADAGTGLVGEVERGSLAKGTCFVRMGYNACAGHVALPLSLEASTEIVLDCTSRLEQVADGEQWGPRLGHFWRRRRPSRYTIPALFAVWSSSTWIDMDGGMSGASRCGLSAKRGGIPDHHGPAPSVGALLAFSPQGAIPRRERRTLY